MLHDPSAIRALQARDGSLVYLVHATPASLPPVRTGDLEAAWDGARAAATHASWGEPRLFRFIRPDGDTLDMVLADDDACCWAAAIDQASGMHTLYGLSLCLRLLALVELLARPPWASLFSRVGRGRAALDPALMRTAAAAPLTDQARFDETAFRLRLGSAAPIACILSEGVP